MPLVLRFPNKVLMDQQRRYRANARRRFSDAASTNNSPVFRRMMARTQAIYRRHRAGTGHIPRG